MVWGGGVCKSPFVGKEFSGWAKEREEEKGKGLVVDGFASCHQHVMGR